MSSYGSAEKKSDGQHQLRWFKKRGPKLSDKLKIALYNVRSIRNKLEYISESLIEFGIDIMCLTETWLVESDTNVVIAALPDCYSMLHVPRSGMGSRGGGVALIYRKSFSTVQTVPQDWDSFEMMEVKLTSNSNTIRLAVVILELTLVFWLSLEHSWRISP